MGLLDGEPATAPCFGVKLGPTTYAVVDFFPDDADRTTHL
jgi:hypothetical protein